MTAKTRQKGSGGKARRASSTDGSSARSRSQHETIVYGNMDWFDVAEQPSSFKDLPKAFETAYDLWKTAAGDNFEKIAALLAPYLAAKFLPVNISGWEELFADPSGEGCPEFEAASIRVAGIDFVTKPIPKCKAEAIFRVPVTEAFGQCEDFQTWQEENDYFYGGVSFGWVVPGSQESDALDLTFGDNLGCECIVDYQIEGDDWPGVGYP